MSELGCLKYYDCGGRFDDLPGIVVVRLGIHEVMPQGLVHSGDAEYPYLFMFFHSPAQVELVPGQVLPAGMRMVIWPPHAKHCYGNVDASWEHSWLILSGASVAELLERYQIPVGTLLPESSRAVFEHYLNAIYEMTISQTQQDPEWNDRLLDLFFYELAQSIHQNAPVVPDNLVCAVKFMERNLAHPVSLKEIARAASLSASHFNVLFKQFYGETPVNHLIRLRMLKAQRLLHLRYIPIKNVALACGYQDPLYFSRYFRQYFGFSPRDCQTEHGVVEVIKDFARNGQE